MYLKNLKEIVRIKSNHFRNFLTTIFKETVYLKTFKEIIQKEFNREVFKQNSSQEFNDFSIY